MPIEFIRNDARRLVTLVGTPPIEYADLTRAADRLVAEGAWSYALLADARRGPVDVADNLAFAAYVRSLADRLGNHGPLAIVSREGMMVARGQVFANLRHETGQTAELFWDMDDADQWLRARGHG
jgi:hypothetical protein